MSAKHRPPKPSQEFDDLLIKLVAVPKSEVESESNKWDALQAKLRSQAERAKTRNSPKSGE